MSEQRTLFDADALRGRGQRTAFVRTVARPTLVLGSTQRATVADVDALRRCNVELVWRRSGGGAVLVEPGGSVWIDTWVPRDDPLFDDDVGRSRRWVGAWWADVLGHGVEVHRDGPVGSRWSSVICFAGVDSGEVLHQGRKVVGVAQWRAREGALTHSFGYLDAEWDRLVELLGLESDADLASAELKASTATLSEVVGRSADSLTERLLSQLPDPGSWVVEPSAAGGAGIAADGGVGQAPLPPAVETREADEDG